MPSFKRREDETDNSWCNLRLKLALDSCDSDNPPIDFENVTPEIFGEYAVGLKKSDGSTPGWSTFNCLRSAIKSLWRDFGHSYDVPTEKQIKLFFKGLKRIVQREREANGDSTKVGKSPLPFSLYQWVAEELLKENSFGHLFTVMSWNLMCRASNAVNIRLKDLGWHADALSVAFTHTKTDQTGKNAAYERNVYANSKKPAMSNLYDSGIGTLLSYHKFWIR